MSTLQVNIGANLTQLEKGLSRASSKVQSFGQSLSSIGTKLTASVTLPLTALGGLALKNAANFETLQQSMNVLNGSVEEGARNFERLKKASARTPFQLNDLAQAQNMLQGFGLAADDAFNSLMMIGDIAAITGGDIQGIGIAFGQAAAEGRLMTRDIRQLINQGVPAIQLLADTMGVAESEILDLASEGQISFQILQKAFREATSEGGMFANGMEQQSNTLAGVFSTLKDNVSIALGELGNAIAETFDLRDVTRRITTALQLITDKFRSMSDESRQRVLKIAAVLAASGPLAIAIGQMAKIIGVFATVVQTAFFKAAAPVIAFGLLLEKQADILAKYNPAIAAFAEGMKINFKNAMLESVTAMGQWISEATGVQGALDALNEAMNETAESTVSTGGLGAPMKEIAMNSEIAGRAVQTFSSTFQQSYQQIAETARHTAQTVHQSANAWPESMNMAMQRIQEKTAQIAMVIRDGMINLAEDFAFAIGRMAASGDGLGAVFAFVLSNLADMAIQIGKIILKSGIAIEALKNALVSFFGGSAIAAGIALIAIGSAAKGALSALGSGGSSRGVGGAGTFQRTVQSQPRNGTVEFVLKGDRLVGVLQNTSKNSGRVGRRIEI